MSCVHSFSELEAKRREGAPGRWRRIFRVSVTRDRAIFCSRCNVVDKSPSLGRLRFAGSALTSAHPGVPRTTSNRNPDLLPVQLKRPRKTQASGLTSSLGRDQAHRLVLDGLRILKGPATAIHLPPSATFDVQWPTLPKNHLIAPPSQRHLQTPDLGPVIMILRGRRVPPCVSWSRTFFPRG
jgi:hypothetical protein